MRVMWALSGEEHYLRLDEGELLIGRSRGCDLSWRHPSLSRRHAVLDRRGERLFVRDLGSRTGVLVNGRRVQAAELEDGDAVRLGALVLSVGGLPRKADRERLAPRTRARRVQAALLRLGLLFLVLIRAGGP